MLKLKNVSKFYYNKGIIASGFTKINLELNIGEFVAITGESGSGKSTLLNVLSGLDSYEEGEMYINGTETSHYTEKEFEEYRRKYVANIFQNFNLINSYTVYQNVELVLLLNGYKKKDIKEKVLNMIDEVGLTKFKNTKVSKLSGGQKQRVAIARAMVKDTPIIVADEPTGNLDTESAKDVIEILKKVAKDKLVIIVTHNLEQIEEYATRIIKMHDGKIVQDTKIKEIQENIEPKPSIYKNMTLINKYRLGIRNTFNIIPKFILLFLVFFFITSAVFTEYTSFKLYEDISSETAMGYMGFYDHSENRILINKQDKTYFTDEDYEKIEKLSNIKNIKKDDLFIDTLFTALSEADSTSFNSMSISGQIKNINDFKGNLDIGRMPENDNEIVIIANKKHYYITDRLDELLNRKFELEELENNELTVVGIKYREEEKVDNYNFDMYVPDNLITNLRNLANKRMSKVKIFFNNKYQESNSYMYSNYLNVLPSKNVAKGKAVVSDNLRLTSGGNIINKDIGIIVDNIYYHEELNLKISNIYTKTNFKRLTGYSNYGLINNNIFINEEDYNLLYNKPAYQASVYVENMKEIDTTMNELENLGLHPKKVTDFGVNHWELNEQIIKIAKVIVTIIVVFVLFFISYFIIRIILKSRNIYFTTLRILGATSKNIKRILDIELFINSSLAFAGVLGFLGLVKADIIHFEYISKLTNYMGVLEYLVLYIVIAVMSRLISRRFSKKLFKKTVITTYNEEV